MDNIWGLINRLGMARIAAMAVVVVMLLGFFIFIIFRFTAPQMAPLYSGLSFDDSAAIVSELQSKNVPFELRNEGETILVDRSQITQIRMSLAENGLPTKGQVGYEIFDQQNTLGATSFVQNINQLRALEGELARTIASLARIKSARVHLVLPQRELFQRDKKDPTASIVLAVRGELSSGEIRAVQHLVSSAVEGLDPNRVSIVDDSGRLLASGAGNSDDITAVASGMEERKLGIESRLRASVTQMLDGVLGPGRARVQVSAEINLNRTTTTSETFDPNSQVVRSSQTRELSDQSKGVSQDGQVSVANELPGASAGNAGGAGPVSQSATTEETTNYEISKTTQTQVSEAGNIKRLSVAVAVDGQYTQDGNGGTTYQPRSKAELDQITSLVQSAVGYNSERGDQIQVVNLQFANRPDLTDAGTSEPGLFDFTRDDLMSAAQMAVTLIISLALLFFVLRPLVRRVLQPDDSPALALPQGAELAASADVQPDAAQPPVPRLPKSDWMDRAKASGESHIETLKDVGGLVEENPKQSALVVRDWLTNANPA